MTLEPTRDVKVDINFDQLILIKSRRSKIPFYYFIVINIILMDFLHAWHGKNSYLIKKIYLNYITFFTRRAVLNVSNLSVALKEFRWTGEKNNLNLVPSSIHCNFGAVKKYIDSKNVYLACLEAGSIKNQV